MLQINIITVIIGLLFVMAALATSIIFGPQMIQENIRVNKNFTVYEIYVDCVKKHEKSMCSHITEKLEKQKD